MEEQDGVANLFLLPLGHDVGADGVERGFSSGNGVVLDLHESGLPGLPLGGRNHRPPERRRLSRRGRRSRRRRRRRRGRRIRGDEIHERSPGVLETQQEGEEGGNQDRNSDARVSHGSTTRSAADLKRNYRHFPGRRGGVIGRGEGRVPAERLAARLVEARGSAEDGGGSAARGGGGTEERWNGRCGFGFPPGKPRRRRRRRRDGGGRCRGRSRCRGGGVVSVSDVAASKFVFAAGLGLGLERFGPFSHYPLRALKVDR